MFIQPAAAAATNPLNLIRQRRAETDLQISRYPLKISSVWPPSLFLQTHMFARSETRGHNAMRGMKIIFEHYADALIEPFMLVVSVRWDVRKLWTMIPCHGATLRLMKC